MLAFNDFEFRLDEIKPRGIWVVRLTSLGNFRHFRITINTRTGKHYDLHIVLPRDEQFQIESDELFWLAALTEHPLEIPVLPPLGGSRTEVGLRSSQYLGGLSVWERIRQLSEIHQWAGYEKNNAWRQLFVKAMAVYFRAWRLSGYKIVPGAISTSNVMVPEVEFHESASILTLTGFKEYENTLSLIKPMMEDFYDKTSALYPWTQETLNADWLFEAIIEGLGIDESIEFLKHFSEDIKANPDVFASDYMIPEKIDLFLDTLKHHYIYPFKLFDAISQYHEWVRINSYATNQGKEQTISELIELFKIYQLPEVVRYYLYRHTYFSSASDKIRSTFDKLLAKLEENVQNQAYQLIELSELQNLITESDLLVFNKMVFPRIQSQSKIDFMKVGENNKGQIIVRTHLTDKKGNTYIMREPVEPTEVGQLYQLFFEENYPKNISKNDKHYVVTDSNNRVIGGLCYKILEDNIVLLDGSAITSPLQGKGIGSAMIEDFFTRMQSMGVNIIKAHFLFGNYYLKHNFKVDQKWGALVKYLN